MCFAPYVSLSTFVIEFLLAIFFFLKNPKDKLNRIIALVSFLLGFYQLNEFLICVTGVRIFTILAMGVTALLPAIGISYALIMYRKKLKYYWDKFWYLLWKDDSLKGWLFSVIFMIAFILIIFFPALKLITGTALPLAIVESCSMYHDGNLVSNYDNWWESHE